MMSFRNKLIVLSLTAPVAVITAVSVPSATTTLAECFNGQTLDSSTGVCPQGQAPASSSGEANQAIKDADAAAQNSSSYAGSH
jgi:hypothetical protein